MSRHQGEARGGSALLAVVGTLLRATKLDLWEDSLLVKEPGTSERTPWHQDLSCFHMSGDQLCTTWFLLDRADRESGAMVFVRGSQRWPELYRLILFVSPMSIPGSEGAEVPDLDARAAVDEIELLSWELEPGDVSVHHTRTLHAAGANRSDP